MQCHMSVPARREHSRIFSWYTGQPFIPSHPRPHPTCPGTKNSVANVRNELSLCLQLLKPTTVTTAPNLQNNLNVSNLSVFAISRETYNVNVRH